MEVQDILVRKENLINFLKEKGLQEEIYYTDDIYMGGTFFKVDKKKLLAIYEIKDEEQFKKVKNHFLIDRGLSYCTIIFNKKLIFFRNFGETKRFFYSERTKNVISKIDKLEKINEEGFDFLFQAGKDISTQFYETFKLKRNLLVQHIKNNIEPIEKYLISQKIFDRFFFIYFLCHKGIIEFENGKKISGKNLFGIILIKDNFLNNLKKLFQTFNLLGEGDKRILKIGNYNIFIPYLNGGLFRPDVLEQDLNISLKKSQWEEIFQFLNSYHWIIEDDKIEEEYEERILTPEILGHVYERSVVEWEQKGFKEEAKEAVDKLSERKKKGVYYTPESITDYISNNTIIPCLLDKLDNKYISFNDLVDSGNTEDYKKAINILNELKVLDPACGSGAFLIKTSVVMFGLKRRLYYELGEKRNFYELKLDIITENIYGVDILAGAIEIAQLRLWLWLISDFEESKNEIKALPNIEYNLKVGNSLVGWFDEKLVQMPMNTPLTEKVDGIFTGLIAYSDIGDGEELKKAREYLRTYNLNDYIEAYFILYKNYRRTHGLKAENLRSVLETIRKSIYATVTPAFLDYVNKKIKPNYNRKKPPITQEEFSELQVFHWRIDFGHIILNGGFDVVIANPPYIDSENMVKKGDKQRDICPIIFKSARGNWDLFIPFVERGLKLAIKNGVTSYIIPNKLIGAKYSEQIKLILATKNIMEIRDYSSVKVFKDANIYPITFVVQNYEPENDVLITVMENDEKIKFANLILKDLFYHDTNWSRYFIENKKALKILVKMSKHKPLNTYHKDICGAATVNEAYKLKEIINENPKPSKKEKKFINTGTIDPYFSYWGFKKTRYIKSNYKYPVLKNSDLSEKFPKRFEQACSEKIIIGGMTKNLECYYDNGEYLAGKSTTIILPGLKNLKFVVSVLNSKLITFWYRINFKALALAGGYLRISNNEVKKIPLVDVDNKQQRPLIDIVEKILELTNFRDYLENKEKQKGVKELQDKIDNLVFKLYDLTPEEIKIVEDFCEKQ